MKKRQILNHGDGKAPRRYKARVAVPAPMPPRCPNCFNHSSKIMDGTKYSNGVRHEYRTCTICGARFETWRDMTAQERREHPKGV